MPPTKEKAVGETVKVYWEKEEEWFPGVIEEYHPKRGYHIQYFDGDDEWKLTLDNVEFEESSRKEFEMTSKTTADELDTFHYFEETEELNIVSPPKSPAKSIVPVGKNNKPQKPEAKQSMDLPPTDDYQSHQSVNRSMLIEDLYKVSKRGVVLVGSVLSFQSFNASIDIPSLFFKVLFVEGGNQPAMFRCKTPIYTSTCPVGNENSWPSWKNARFRFDMLMPEADNGTVKIQGEILIAVYSSRSNGGNELIGQTSVELSNMAQFGTIENLREGIEGRSITGAYPALSRAGDEVGELHFNLNIAFPSALLNPIKASSDDIERKTSTGKVRPVSAGAISVSKASKSGSANKDAGKNTAAGSGASRAVSASGSKRVTNSVGKSIGGGTVIKGADGVMKVHTTKKTIISALAGKQKHDARRIERENREMRNRLSAHGTRHTANVEAVYSGAVSAPQPPAAPPAGLPAQAEPKRYYSIVPCDDEKVGGGGGAKGIGGGGDAKGAKGEGGSGGNYNELLRVYNETKRANTVLDNDCQALKANLNKITTHIRKYQTLLEKMRSRNPQIGGALMGSSGSGAGAAAAGAATAGEGHFVPVVEEDLEILEPEHKNIAEEYNILQNIRRGLVERIKLAKEKLSTSGASSAMVKDRYDLLKERVSYLANASSGAEAKDEKGVMSGFADSSNSGEVSDYTVFERLRSINLEVMRTEDIIKHQIHTMSLTSNIEELSATQELLSKQCSDLEAEIERWKAEKARKRDQLQALMGTNEVLFRRQCITQMTQTLMNLEINERLSTVEDSYKTIELEMLRMKLRQKERRQLANE